jgi:tetratricopeptide (TPR) repeat protein
MRGLPEDQKSLFDNAVRTFRGEGPVRVSPEKLSAFLHDTREIPRAPADRLRRLAIGLEHDRFERGWEDLRAIYQAAADADPKDPFVLHSWGISAHDWMEDWMTPELSDRVGIAAEAERVLRAALDLAPRSAFVAHTLGLSFYNHPARTDDPERYRTQAIDWFARAVEWDPEYVISQLYLAHCFHDAQEWPRAIAEYEKIDLDQLAGDWPAWRAVKCREQLAHCHAYAGNTEEAVRRFTEFLDELETWDEEKFEECVINIDEMVDAVTQGLDHPELLRRVRDLSKRIHWSAKRYEQFFSC